MPLPFLHLLTPRERSRNALGVDPIELTTQVPRTQELIDVVDAHEDCLVLHDATVVGGVQFQTQDDTLLTEPEIQDIQDTFYQLLISLDFPIQFLITTRPQNLETYFDSLLQVRDQHQNTIFVLERFAGDIGRYVMRTNYTGEAAFTSFFGLSPNAFMGVPGLTRTLAWGLCDPATLAKVRGKSLEEQEQLTQECQAIVAHSVMFLRRWRRALSEQLDMVRQTVERSQAPVRCFYFLVSHNPRLLKQAGPVTEPEFQAASERIETYCAQLTSGIERMGLPVQRATHEALLLDIRRFFNPSQGLMASRVERQEHLLLLGHSQAEVDDL